MKPDWVITTIYALQNLWLWQILGESKTTYRPRWLVSLKRMNKSFSPDNLVCTWTECILNNRDLGWVNHLFPCEPHIGPFDRLLLQGLLIYKVEINFVRQFKQSSLHAFKCSYLSVFLSCLSKQEHVPLKQNQFSNLCK